MQLGPPSKLETKNTKMLKKFFHKNIFACLFSVRNDKLVVLKKFKDEVMSANYGIIIIFPIYDQFGAIRKPDSGCKVHNSQILSCSLIMILYLVKTEIKD